MFGFIILGLTGFSIYYCIQYNRNCIDFLNRLENEYYNSTFYSNNFTNDIENNNNEMEMEDINMEQQELNISSLSDIEQDSFDNLEFELLYN